MRLQRVTALRTEDGTSHQVVQQRPASKTYGKRFMILFTDDVIQATRQAKSLITLKLLHELPRHLNFVDFVQVRTVELAELLNTGSGSISVSMRELLELGILEREGKGPRTAWRLSSNYGWSGSTDQYHAFRAGRLRGKKPPKTGADKSHNGYYGK